MNDKIYDYMIDEAAKIFIEKRNSMVSDDDDYDSYLYAYAVGLSELIAKVCDRSNVLTWLKLESKI